jgi:molecular chaperone GrpE (heat shock protein)
MATFGAGFIGVLLKSAHQQGEGEKTIGEMKGIAQYIKNITNKLTETAEWFTGDLSTLTSVLSYLNEIKKSLAESADKNTNLGIDILTRIDVLLTTITDVVDRVKKEGSTKAIAAVEDLEESDSSAFEVFKSDPLKFFDSLPTFMSLSVKIDDMKKAIMSNMHTGFEFQSTQLRLASSKLGTLSTYLDVQNKFSGKALGDLKNMTVDAQKKQEVNGFPLKKFLLKKRY